MANELMEANQSKSSLPISMQIMFDQNMFERTKEIAKYMSNAKGFTPPHLIGKPESCFAVVMRSMTWRLDPFAVACGTYDVHGKVGYEGKLCQAILESSGRIEGQIEYDYHGDWSKVQGKFKKVKSEKGGEYAVAAYTADDEAGLGVTIRAQLIGEKKKREFRFDMIQAFPRNSTLWATDPKTQLGYAAIRRFASVATPALIMGVPFEGDDNSIGIKDVTPRDNSAMEAAFKDSVLNNEDIAPETKEEIKKPSKLDTLLDKKESVHSEPEIATESTLYDLQMPNGVIMKFPTELDTIGLMQELQGMIPPDEKDFVRNNIDVLPDIIAYMKANDKPLAASSLEKILAKK